MFAVPGWSVSADKLKTETLASGPAAGDASGPKSKKRKRPNDVTAANVANLWEQVIEHKEPKVRKSEASTSGGKEKKKSKKEKKPRPEGNSDEPSGKTPIPSESSPKVKKTPKEELALEKLDSKSEKKQKKEKKEKKEKREKEQKGDSISKHSGGSKTTTTESPSPVRAPPPAPPKLTPLQAAMREKLVSARFRHLNETLYTRPSAEAYQLFQESPEMFQEYHEGFRRQVDVWPENPVDDFIQEIRLRARQRFPSRGDRRPPSMASQQGGVLPLPRTSGTCIIADLGCGDARLASSLQGDSQKLRLDIHSFDLHSPSRLVTKADIANVPLAEGAVDVAIFCLALMGTNWIDFIEEAYRILHWKGELWVAEIKSRFGHVGKGKSRQGQHIPVEHSVGNRRKEAAGGQKSKSKKKQEEEETNEKELAVTVDGAEDMRQQTDVSAFVEALRKRGFVLHGEGDEAVDLSNKMFVRMRFLKALPAVKGKMAGRGREMSQGMAKKTKFLLEDDGAVDEAAILKPCVYKLR